MVEVYEDREARNSVECDCYYCEEYSKGRKVCFCDSDLCPICGGCTEHCVHAVCVNCDQVVTFGDESCPNCGAPFVKMR